MHADRLKSGFNNGSIGRNLLLLISFIEGGAVMIIELLGAKIIAPFYGTSLYVWSSVLGVTLAALALGYFSGGFISKKFPGEKSLFLALLAGAFFTILAPIIAPAIMQTTDAFGVRIGSLISVFLYLFPPIVFMGMISPLIIQLVNKDATSAGNSAGTVYAISTVGGILATFLAGFYMIPQWGIHMSAYVTGGLLFSISAFYFLLHKKFNYLMVEAAMIILFVFLRPDYVQSTQNTEILFSKVGLLGEWTVIEYINPRDDGSTGKERRLLLNGVDQTYTQVGFEPLSLWVYPHKIGAYSSVKPPGSKALLLGMGGGSIAHELVSIGLDLDIVELDESVKHISKTYFNYDETKSNLYIDDARHFIRTTEEKYDVVIIDLILGEIQPAHVFSLEGFQDLKRIVHPDALVIINFQGTLEVDEYSLGPKSIFKTLQHAGFYVDYYYQYGDTSTNITARDMFFIASLKDLNYKDLLRNVRYNQWFQFDNFFYDDLIQEKELDLSNAIILTDDKPILEQLNAEAILDWRQTKIDKNINRMLDEKLPIY
jgi:predicted membrane-bound spermidine synthase